MATAPIYNPVVPFTMGVAMQPSLMVYVTGTPTGGRFSINLKTGPSPGDDIAFHFNPRFDQGNVIVRNTRSNGHWGQEERQATYFPFCVGQQFEAILLCQPHQVKVAVNGRHLLEYRHRLPLQSIKYLGVEGGISLSVVRTDLEYPSKPAALTAPRIINNPSLPGSFAVPFHNIKGHKVTISGVPLNQHPHKFIFDLKAASPGNDIFLHFNPRFNERQIVRNSLLSGGWGSEERQLSTPFPFQYGIPYQITIQVDQGSFRVLLNGMQLFSYGHRKRPLNLIRQIGIHGATSVSRIAFE